MDKNILLAGSGLLVACIIGYVVLLESHTDSSDARGLFLFVIPIVTGMFTASQVKSVQDATKDVAQKVDTVQKQTNGVLSTKVTEVAHSAAVAAVQEHLAATNPAIVNQDSAAVTESAVVPTKTAAKRTAKKTTTRKATS